MKQEKNQDNYQYSYQYNYKSTIQKGAIQKIAVYRSKQRSWLYLGLSALLLQAFLHATNLHAEWVEYINDASIAITHSDNVNQSAFSEDELTDTSINPRYTFGRYYQMDDLTRLRLELGLSANFYDEFDKLNSVDAIGSAIVRHKFGVGFTKPWMRGNVSVGRKNADVAIRDSDLFAVGISTGKRFNRRLSGQVGLTYNKRDGGTGNSVVAEIPTNVFDFDSVSVTGGVEYLLDERSQITASWTHREGEFDSACTGDNLQTVLDSEKDNVKALTQDDVFGICVYRLDGSSDSLQLQYNYALGRHSSLNLGYQLRQGEADVLEYDTALWTASFMYSK